MFFFPMGHDGMSTAIKQYHAIHMTNRVLVKTRLGDNIIFLIYFQGYIYIYIYRSAVINFIGNLYAPNNIFETICKWYTRIMVQKKEKKEGLFYFDRVCNEKKKKIASVRPRVLYFPINNNNKKKFYRKIAKFAVKGLLFFIIFTTYNINVVRRWKKGFS